MSKDIVGKSWQTKQTLTETHTGAKYRNIEDLVLIDDTTEHILNGLDVTWYTPRERRDGRDHYDIVATRNDKELGSFISHLYYEPVRPLKKFVFSVFTHQYAQSLHLKNVDASYGSFELVLCDQPDNLCRWPGVAGDIRRLSLRAGVGVCAESWCAAYLGRPDLARHMLDVYQMHSTKPVTIFQKSEHPKFTAGACVRIGRLVLKRGFSGDPVFYTKDMGGGVIIEKENYL